jgi:streptomycin 6-kinase
VHEFRGEPGWLDALPRLAAECAELWKLELEAPIDTAHSLVVPAGDAVLKINAPGHFEADHEVDALERWEGDGAVRVLARDDERRAYLMERCVPGATLWDSDADETAVIADLLQRLSKDVPPDTFRRVPDEAARWAREVPERYEAAGQPFELRLLEQALETYRTTDSSTALVNQDLHGLNVLDSDRGWLVIDPKPLVGEREVNGVGLLRNAALRGGTMSVRRWLEALSELGLDRERLRGWGVAHALAWGWEPDSGWDSAMVGAAGVIRDA